MDNTTNYFEQISEAIAELNYLFIQEGALMTEEEKEELIKLKKRLTEIINEAETVDSKKAKNERD